MRRPIARTRSRATAAAAGRDAGDEAETGPERRCLATGAVRPKAALIRFVLGPEGRIVPDVAGNLPGRGLWLTARRDIVPIVRNDENLRSVVFVRGCVSPVSILIVFIVIVVIVIVIIVIIIIGLLFVTISSTIPRLGIGHIVVVHVLEVYFRFAEELDSTFPVEMFLRSGLPCFLGALHVTHNFCEQLDCTISRIARAYIEILQRGSLLHAFSENIPQAVRPKRSQPNSTKDKLSQSWESWSIGRRVFGQRLSKRSDCSGMIQVYLLEHDPARRVTR